MFNGLGNGEFLEEEARLLQLEAERRARYAAMSAEELLAVEKQKAELTASIKQLNINTLILNKVNPAVLPLNSVEESFRQASVAGDFLAMNRLMIISKWRWNETTPLGKYRFNIVNGQKQYVAFSDQDILNFLSGPWFTPNRYGYANMIEPGASCDINHMADLFIAGQRGVVNSYSPNDWQYVFPIYPGLYICQVYKGSTWVRWRATVWTAVGIVAAIYLGPIILDKVAAGATASSAEVSGGIVGAGTKAGTVTAVTTKATTAAAITTKAGAIAATAAETTTFFQTVQSGGNALLEYVNKARTIEAIANGEMPPPPISIVGDTFTDWAMTVVKDQIAKEAQQRAMELGQEYIARKLTEAEEAQLRAEIQAMQAELAALMPAGISATPDARVPAEVQAASAALALKEKQAQDAWLMALAIAVPAGFLLLS